MQCYDGNWEGAFHQNTMKQRGEMWQGTIQKVEQFFFKKKLIPDKGNIYTLGPNVGEDKEINTH